MPFGLPRPPAGHRAAAVLALAAIGGGLLSGAAIADPVGLGPWSSPTYVYAASDIQEVGYAYAPSVIAGHPERIYTCHSRTSGVIRDDIFLTKRSGGAIISSSSVLSAGTGWDSFHICDPSVVRVNVLHNGHTHPYAMFYLGNDVDASRHNQVGVAVADSLDGPWTRTGTPVVPYTAADQFQWGAGQPTATTIDPDAGTVLLAWTEGYSTGTVARVAKVDFSGGTPVLTDQHALPTAGLTDSGGNPDFVNNFDLAYSPARDRFYLVREGHPYPTGSSPDYISSHVQVSSIAGSDLWSGTGSWTPEGEITTAVTGHPRTHNPGFVRTVYGTLPDESQLSVVFTTAQLDPGSLFSYELWQTTASLN